MTFLLGLLTVVLGLVAVFFGYRFFRILLPFFGGIAGFIIASNLFPNSWFLSLVIGIILAILLAIFAYQAWSVLFTISGAIAGATFGAAIASTLNLWDWVAWLLVIGSAIIVGWLVWKFRDEMVIVITALAGASLVSEGLTQMFGSGTFRNLLWWIVFFVLAAIGIVFQWGRWLRYNWYRDLGRNVNQAVASGAAADAAAKARAASAPVAPTTTAPAATAATATAAATAAAAATKAKADEEAAAAKRAADEAAAKVAAQAEAARAPTVDITEAAAPKLTAEEKQAALDAHIDALLNAEGDRSNLHESVGELKDISPEQVAKLKSDGVEIIADILRRGATPQGRAEMAKATGIPEARILKWVNFADLLRIKGVGAVFARLLEVAGVDTVVELAQRNPVNLHAKLVETNDGLKLAGRDPRQDEVTDWVAQAKELPRVVEY